MPDSKLASDYISIYNSTDLLKKKSETGTMSRTGIDISSVIIRDELLQKTRTKRVPHTDLVSVIIPTYNRANLLLQAVESVRRQTWPYVQIIVVDDGSTDNTQALMESMADIRYVRKENGGQASARNAGLQYAEGAFVCSLDSDDLWSPEFLESGICALRTLNVDFVFANWVGETVDGKRHASAFEVVHGWKEYQETELEGWRVLEPQQTRDLYIEGCASPSSSLIIRREFLNQGWMETLKIGDDWCMLLDIVLSRPCRTAIFTRPLWVKRVAGDNIYDHRDGIEVTRDMHIHDSSLILKRFHSVLTAQECALFYARLAFHQANLAKWELRQRDLLTVPSLSGKALVCFMKSIVCSPSTLFRRIHKRRNYMKAISRKDHALSQG